MNADIDLFGNRRSSAFIGGSMAFICLGPRPSSGLRIPSRTWEQTGRRRKGRRNSQSQVVRGRTTPRNPPIVTAVYHLRPLTFWPRPRPAVTASPNKDSRFTITSIDTRQVITPPPRSFRDCCLSNPSISLIKSNLPQHPRFRLASSFHCSKPGSCFKTRPRTEAARIPQHPLRSQPRSQPPRAPCYA